MILDIISLFGGGLLRLLPEILHLINKKTDNKHELDLMDKQIDLQKLKGDQELEHTQMQGDFNNALAMMNLHAEALRGQMQKTSIWIVDVLNFLVRPITTYYFLAMYGAFKLGLLIVAYRYQQDFWQVMTTVYDDQDRQALWGILGFWFVGRTFEKSSNTPTVVPYKAPGNGQF